MTSGLPATKRIWTCSVCGFQGEWGNEWTCYTSLMIEDTYPEDRIICCCDGCKDTANKRMESGKMALPKISQRGYSVKKIKNRIGY